MLDDARCMNLIKESEGIYVDFSRQRVTQKTTDVSGQPHGSAHRS